MFKIQSQIKNFFISVLAAVLSLLSISNAYSQFTCPGTPAITQDYVPESICALDKELWWEIAFRIDPNDLDPAAYDGYFVEIDFTLTDTQDWLPSSFTLENITALPPPPRTEWEFEIYRLVCGIEGFR